MTLIYLVVVTVCSVYCLGDRLLELYGPSAIAEARERRDIWAKQLHTSVEQLYDTAPLLNSKCVGGNASRPYPDFSSLGHRAFDLALGPVGPRCRNLESYGQGDDEKRVCNLSNYGAVDDCLVLSLGSNNQWAFEIEILKRTKCSVAVFDCTIDFRVPEDVQGPRLTTHNLCISDRRYTNEKGWKFVRWNDALRIAGIKAVTHLKMDIEGFEYSVLTDVVTSFNPPQQISLELHYSSQMQDLSWNWRSKTPAEMAIFMQFLYLEGGYFVIDRKNNPLCPHCTEIVLARFLTDVHDIKVAVHSRSGVSIGDECLITQHWPTPELPIPLERSCCAWLTSINTKGGTPVDKPPAVMLAAFEFWGQAKVEYSFYNNHYFGKTAMLADWSYSTIDQFLKRVQAGDLVEPPGYPGAGQIVADSLNAFGVKGLTGAVFGSETPWLEATLLSYGARHITTIEYGTINCTHPDISTLTPAELRKDAHKGNYVGVFDFVYTYSSLEHSGLGRYGDALAPFADLEWIERIKCMLKPHGKLYFGVPISDTDCVVFNAHRIYGPHRLAAVQQGFNVLQLFGQPAKGCGVQQPVLVMELQ